MKRKLMFAYGSNMFKQQAIKRMPNLIKYGIGNLLDYSFSFSGNGVATVYKKTGSFVPGIIYSVTNEDFLNMNYYEGFPHVYNCYLLPINHNGKIKDSWVYINNCSFLKSIPRKEYLFKIINGAEEAGISTEHILEAYTNALDSIKM